MSWIRRYFIAGLLVIVPIWGTYLVLRTLFGAMDGVLGGLLKGWGIYYYPGFGIVVLGVVIFAVGIFATNILGKRLFLLWEDFLRHLPLVRNIYSLVKSIVDTLSIQGEGKEGFSRVVLIEYPRRGSFAVGFVTAEMRVNGPRMPFEKVINVFVPTAPNPISGFLLHVPESDLIPVSLSVEEAMKMVVSAGLHSPAGVSEIVAASPSLTLKERQI